jgi:hypothetical protein
VVIVFLLKLVLQSLVLTLHRLKLNVNFRQLEFKSLCNKLLLLVLVFLQILESLLKQSLIPDSLVLLYLQFVQLLLQRPLLIKKLNLLLALLLL